MDINKRIADLKPFFAAFNVAAEDDVSYIVIKVPSHWVIEPLIQSFKDEYHVEPVVRTEGIYLFTEIKNGVEPLFDCADMVISYNKNIETRKTLLKEKIEELTHLFATEPLEKLETIAFTMDETPEDAAEVKTADKPTRRNKKAAKANEQITEAAHKAETEDKETQQKETTVEKNENRVEDNSLMALARNLTGE